MISNILPTPRRSDICTWVMLRQLQCKHRANTLRTFDWVMRDSLVGSCGGIEQKHKHDARVQHYNHHRNHPHRQSDSVGVCDFTYPSYDRQKESKHQTKRAENKHVTVCDELHIPSRRIVLDVCVERCTQENKDRRRCNKEKGTEIHICEVFTIFIHNFFGNAGNSLESQSR